MPPASSSFMPLNLTSASVPEWMGSFTLSAPPNTDLWRKPPHRDTSTAPVLYTALRRPFVSAEVTVSADWELEWDQGGLVIFAGQPPGRETASTSTATTEQQPTRPEADVSSRDEALPPYRSQAPVSKWVKVGLEFCNNTCNATSVCATSDGADWSLSALPQHHAPRTDLKVKLERIGYALWIWYEDDMVGWKKLREVTWFFFDVEDKSIRVGCYASRPANFGLSRFERRHENSNRVHRDLCVDFEGLEIF